MNCEKELCIKLKKFAETTGSFEPTISEFICCYCTSVPLPHLNNCVFLKKAFSKTDTCNIFL